MTGGQMETVNVNLFGHDPKVQKAVSTAKNVSVTKAPVLVSGEAGVGKRTLARFIHQNSNREAGPLEFVDCSGDSVDVENQILGHRDEETGSFIKGVLERANGGTVVLCNVDGLGETFQKRLHGIFLELDDYDIDLRIVSTTTKNLSKLVGAGRFYRGLYNIISSNSINLIPLRERQDDLLMLAQKFVNELSEGVKSISPEGIQKILSHYWTHNICELRSVIEASIEKAENDVLAENEVLIGERRVSAMMSDDDSEGIRLMSLKDAEKLLIKKALIHTSENRTQAAKILGVSIRTLRNKINEYRSDGNTYFVNLR
jgi:two-component system response regulator FlrC